MWLAFIFLNTEVLKLDKTVCVGRPRRMRKSSFSVRAQSSASKCTSNKFLIEFHHSLCWTFRSGQEVVAWEKTSKISTHAKTYDRKDTDKENDPLKLWYHVTFHTAYIPWIDEWKYTRKFGKYMQAQTTNHVTYKELCL